MPKFDVRVTVDFDGVETDDEAQLQEMIDNAMGDGAVLFTNPTTGEEIASDTRVLERG